MCMGPSNLRSAAQIGGVASNDTVPKDFNLFSLELEVEEYCSKDIAMSKKGRNSKDIFLQHI